MEDSFVSTEQWLSLLDTDEAAQALSALCVRSKTQKEREIIEKALSYARVQALVQSPLPKVRKNTYRLVGTIKAEAYLPLLQQALSSESTLFCIPSLILALGSLGDKESLESYQIPPTQVDKHQAEIALALQKALNLFDNASLGTIKYLAEPKKLLCYAPKGFEDCLKEELIELGFECTCEGEAIAVFTDKLAKLMQARCLLEALFPIASGVKTNALDIANAVGPIMGKQYRIELRGYTRDRAKLIGSIAKAIGGKNNPSNYDSELRIECRMDDCDLYWKLYNIKDNRFSYRKNTIAASINPSTAACIVRYAKRFEQRPRPTVLDPFCGSGTLLFERERLSPCSLLLGVDKNSKAIEIARGNAKAGVSKASFVCKDALRFDASNGVDVIISNLPFGNRVGSHNDNTQLYRAFVKKIPRLLRPNGVAILYTMESRLMEDCLKREPRLRLIERKRTEAGGLLPWIFVIGHSGL